MRKTFLLSFVSMALALSAAGPPAPACADEGMQPDRAMQLAGNTPSTQHGNGFGILTVSAPQPLPAANAAVTLWDEIPPPPLLPMPLPAPQPGDVRHAMEGNARGNTHP
ncbi:hypothetical protein WS54_17440 [Burkholderia sp. NRF60-BP8]|nr:MULTISPECIES: hypothetical protein [unclassified Burkholderia]AOI78118.1 hypothetical protein WS54_17440 [Burkholderia sp. NRF60-BP8]KVA18148.1 hypothetical protein WS54_06115 [Burkholderia sp. NRF60-BP8]KVL16896.1 hypothetical protein WS95_01265 [Burkholderia sp. MSMB1826]